MFIEWWRRRQADRQLAEQAAQDYERLARLCESQRRLIAALRDVNKDLDERIIELEAMHGML